MAISDWKMAEAIKKDWEREKDLFDKYTYDALRENPYAAIEKMKRAQAVQMQKAYADLTPERQREAQWGKPTPKNINDIGIFTMDIDGVAALWKAKHSDRWVCEQDLRKSDDEDSAFILTRLRSTGLLECLKTDTHTFWRTK